MLIVLAWVPILVSVTLLVVYWLTDDLSVRRWWALTIGVLLAAWLQFFSRSAPWPTVGLVLQCLIAVILTARMKLR